jgi:hypothetical protein
LARNVARAICAEAPQAARLIPPAMHNMRSFLCHISVGLQPPGCMLLCIYWYEAMSVLADAMHLQHLSCACTTRQFGGGHACCCCRCIILASLLAGNFDKQQQRSQISAVYMQYM